MRRPLMLMLALFLLLAGCASAPSAARTGPMRFAFVRQGALWLWEDGKERRLAEAPGIIYPQFSPDGRFIAYRQNEALTVIRTDGAGPWVVTPTHGPSDQAGWSPTENRLALANGQKTVTVAVTDDGPQDPQLVADGWSGVAWSPDGRTLAVARSETAENIFTGLSRVGLVARSGGEVRVIGEARFSPEDGCAGSARPQAWSPDGEWLLVARPGLWASLSADCNQLTVLSTQGGPLHLLGETPNLRWADWSPREKPLLAFTDGTGRPAFYNKQVRLARPPWAESRSLTPDGYADREPAFSPGGRYLAFTRSRSGWIENMHQPAPDQAIHLADIDEGGSQPIPGSEGGFGPFWGGDGTLFWFKNENGSIALYHGRDDLPNPLIKGLDLASSYYGQWDWPRVLDAHVEPPPYSRP